MATYTENYKLKKPAPEDFADIADLNENADKIDTARSRIRRTSTSPAS